MNESPTLLTRTTIDIRFSEVDMMQIVWHGHYLKFIEEGREDFGRKFGIGYMDFRQQGFMVPIVKVALEYKKPLIYGDKAIVETHFRNSDAAKLIYDYKIFRSSDNELVATGESMQVFLNMDRELVLTIPTFLQDWKKKRCL